MEILPNIYFRSPVVRTYTGSGFSYQLARKEGVTERWELVKPHIEKNTSVLDIGCNAGLLTAKTAQSGRFVIGIEANEATVTDAIEYHGKCRDFGLINKRITPENVDSLPTFDYVYLFSVYHQLYNIYGQETAEDLLYKIYKKTSRKLFFEPASQKYKYDNPELPFEDFDKQSIKEYNIEMLKSVVGSDNEIEYLGDSSRRKVSRGERHLFVINKH